MPRSVSPSPPAPPPPPLPTHAGRYELTETGDDWNRTDEDATLADAVVVAEVIEPAEPPPLALPPAAPQSED
jgi:hypothetical protein